MFDYALNMPLTLVVIKVWVGKELIHIVPPLSAGGEGGEGGGWEREVDGGGGWGVGGLNLQTNFQKGRA